MFSLNWFLDVLCFLLEMFCGGLSVGFEELKLDFSYEHESFTLEPDISMKYIRGNLIIVKTKLLPCLHKVILLFKLSVTCGTGVFKCNIEIGVYRKALRCQLITFGVSNNIVLVFPSLLIPPFVWKFLLLIVKVTVIPFHLVALFKCRWKMNMDSTSLLMVKEEKGMPSGRQTWLFLKIQVYLGLCASSLILLILW